MYNTRNSGDGSLEERVAQFDEFTKEFIQLYTTAKERCMSTKNSDMTLEQALDSLDDVSNVVTQHVSKSGVLRGLNVSLEEMIKLIESDEQLRDFVKLQSECLYVLSRLTANDWQLGILSINWCPALIHATVVHPLEESIEPPNDLNVPIWSNTVDSNGVVSLKVPGALAKKACIAKVKPSNYVVYVGDSSTDLLALMEADLGILIGSCDSAVATAKQWGVQVKPLKHRKDALVNTCNVIWKAENWSEIDCVLKGIEL